MDNVTAGYCKFNKVSTIDIYKTFINLYIDKVFSIYKLFIEYYKLFLSENDELWWDILILWNNINKDYDIATKYAIFFKTIKNIGSIVYHSIINKYEFKNINEFKEIPNKIKKNIIDNIIKINKVLNRKYKYDFK